MNLTKKEERLKYLIEHNVQNEKIGTAIAITGSWGVGKTFFWKSFLDKQLTEERIYKKDNVFNRKYAYVSLFGLESLSDVKTQIYSSIESYHSLVEIPKWIKSLPSIFKDTRITQLGINAPVKLIDSLMFAQVKDAIICFDDFERLSNKLDIKDVMGLANYLKLEKNCQIVLILNESKTEDENTNKYSEYKEKLVDDIIIINSVEPLILSHTQDIDQPLVKLMIQFAEELDIHNFRFFQKVIKLYREFRNKLPENVADSIKQIILTRILQGYFIEDYGLKRDFNWTDFRLIIDELKKDWSDTKRKNYLAFDRLSNVYFELLTQDEMSLLCKKWFEQTDDFSFDEFLESVNLMHHEAQKDEYRREFHNLANKYNNYLATDEFINDFFEVCKECVNYESVDNLEWAIQIFEKHQDFDKVYVIENMVKERIRNVIKSSTSKRTLMHLNSGHHRFKEFFDQALEENKFTTLPSLAESLNARFVEQAWSQEHELAISNASEGEWEAFLFDLDDDNKHQYPYLSIGSIDNQLSRDVREKIINILQKRGEQSSFLKCYTDSIIARLRPEIKKGVE